MIERDFVSRKKVEHEIHEFIAENLKGAGLSHSKLQRTPLGEKIIIYASRPGLIIGGGGSNIKKLTAQLKKKFGLENPQIEISEIPDQNLVAAVVAEKIAIGLEKFGTARFKGIGHKAMEEVLGAGARGIEILVSGKIPSARAKKWRFYQGYLKKCGDPAMSLVDTAYASAKLKSGIVGVKVSIMPPNVKLPDDLQLKPDIKPNPTTEIPLAEEPKQELVPETQQAKEMQNEE